MGRLAGRVWVVDGSGKDEEDRWAILSGTQARGGTDDSRSGGAEKAMVDGTRLDAADKESPAGSGPSASDEPSPFAPRLSAPDKLSAVGTRLSDALKTRTGASRRARSGKKRCGPKSWGRPLLAYLFGPLTVALWLNGQRRKTWAAVGLGSVAAGVLLVLFRSPFMSLLEALPHGGLFWVATVPAVVLLVGLAWARSIDAAIRRSAIDRSRLPIWVSDPRTVAAMGLIVPGLGLLIAGHPKRAACAFWIVGPLGAGAAVLTRWRWLWERSAGAGQPGIPGLTLEVAFVFAGIVTLIMSLAWLVQALDGARLAATTRSRLLTDFVSVALLVSLVLFAATCRPVSLARDLHVASVSLRLEGLRLIPLALCDTAARLDPVEPIYLADAADLNDSLGMEGEARSKRQLVAHRLTEYLAIVSRDEGADRGTLARLSAIHLSGGRSEPQMPAEQLTWPRVRALYR